MSTHPLMQNEIAQARSAEKLARGLAAYRALRARTEQEAEVGTDGAAARRIRFLDRLRRREASTRGPARQAT
jgi:hypothetical protein